MASPYIALAELQHLAERNTPSGELLRQTLPFARFLHDLRMTEWIQLRQLDANRNEEETVRLIRAWLKAVEDTGMRNLVDADSATGYDVAQICLTGHVVNPVSKSSPAENRPFCSRCGAKTISYCSTCEKPIRGAFEAPDVIGDPNYSLPAFCENCGAAFAWTDQKVTAAKEFTDTLHQLTADERESLKTNIDDLVHETPRTPVAESKVKALLKKAGHEAAEGIRELIVDIVSETVKKTMWP